MLYLKIVNDQAVDSPVFYSNLIGAYGYVPSEYEPFIRNVTYPSVGPLEYFDMNK